MDFYTTPGRKAQSRPVRYMDEDLGRQEADWHAWGAVVCGFSENRISLQRHILFRDVSSETFSLQRHILFRDISSETFSLQRIHFRDTFSLEIYSLQRYILFRDISLETLFLQSQLCA